MKVNRLVMFGTIGIALASATLFKAAPQAKAPLSFEVATIKPNAAGDNRTMMQNAPGGRLNMTGINLKRVILNAYKIQDFQVAGGPGWMDSDRWDIQTKAEENATPAQVSEMLQTLLAERFQLKFHRENREAQVYNLVVAKNGPKLEESKLDGGPGAANVTPFGRGGAPGAGPSMAVGRGQFAVMNSGAKTQVNGGAMPMSQFASMLGNLVGRTVIDKTGLTGNYDVKLEWTPDPGQGPAFGGPPPGGGDRGAAPADAPLPSLFTAIQEQLGLRLDSTKGPVEVFIIDRVEKPTEPQLHGQ